MNIETGEIIKISKEEINNFFKEEQELIEKLVPININDTTEKQKKEMKVSLYDHKSKLGKQLQNERKKWSKNKLKRWRKRNK